jgi:hypothetical protein
MIRETARAMNREFRPGALVVLGWMLLTLTAFGGASQVRAAEWSSPPGINVASQEAALRDRITRSARAVIGDNLADVIVHIGYVRVTQAGKANIPDRLKLPGFNNYIDASGAKPEIVSEFSRVREAFVIVSDAAKVQAESLARELAAQAGMDPAQGDTLRVVPVAMATGAAAQGAAPAKMEMPGGPRAPEEPNALARPETKPLTPKELQEPKSTSYLMQARRSYFAGDYQGSLEQILQAVTVDPGNAQAYAMLGSLYFAMNWKSLAVKYWQRSLELDPSNREIEDLISQIRLGQP